MSPMEPLVVEAAASPNIAFIKYWGNQDHDLRLPANDSLSMTLGGLETRVRLTLDPTLAGDRASMDSRPLAGVALQRLSGFLDLARSMSGRHAFARIETRSNFPHGVGIASSAAVFAALAMACDAAYGLNLGLEGLSRLARQGSGSAARSIFGGFVLLHAGTDDAAAYAEPFLPTDHWDLLDLIAIVDTSPKLVGSSEGHRLAETSPIQSARVQDTPRRLRQCAEALTSRDFAGLAQVIQQDSDLMHAVMMSSTPPLHYWQPATLAIMQSVLTWQSQGLNVAYTVDAGPNAHCICTSEDAPEVQDRLRSFPEVQTILRCPPGEGARLL